MDRCREPRYAGATCFARQLTMRPLLYLSSLALALPGLALAAAFLVLGNAIAAGSLLGFLGALLDTFVWLFPWGLLACATVFVTLVAGGVSARFRWLASACVAAIAIGSSLVVLALAVGHDNFSPGQLAFFIPAVASASIGVWLSANEWPRCRIARGGDREEWRAPTAGTRDMPAVPTRDS
jgi:hypothetical protein